MEYRKLERSTLSVSTIGFGCMSLTEGEDSGNEKLLLAAFDAGINLFDTADLYQHGRNESFVGKVLRQKRNQIVLASKVGNQWRADGSGWDWNPRKEYILKCADESLVRLQTDHIDLYQLHGGTIDDNIDESISAFELLKQQGKILYYGISSIRPNVIREYVKRSNIISVMMQYSLLDRRPEENCLELLQENKIGVLVRGALAQGLIVDKPEKSYLDYTSKEVEAAASAVGKASEGKRSKTATALHFVMQNPAISSVVVGIRTMKQLNEALKTLETPPLNQQELQLLRDSIPVNTYQQHR